MAHAVPYTPDLGLTLHLTLTLTLAQYGQYGCSAGTDAEHHHSLPYQPYTIRVILTLALTPTLALI